MKLQNTCSLLLFYASLILHPFFVQVETQPVTLTDLPSTQSSVSSVMVLRSYKNVIAYLQPLIFCSYYNNTAKNCVSVSLNGFNGLFYEDETSIYFVMSLSTYVNIYKVQATETNVIYSLRWTSIGLGYPEFYAISIDYRHRWLAMGGPTSLYLFDISKMSYIMNSHFYTYPTAISGIGNYYPRLLSMHRQLVCQNAPGGFYCCPISRGKFTTACSRITSVDAIYTLYVYDDYIITCGSPSGIHIFNATTRQSIGSLGGDCLDFFRSNNTIIYSDWWNSKVHVVNMTNPSNCTFLTSVNVPAKPWALFANQFGIYYGREPSNYVRELRINNSQTYEKFFSNSDYFDMGRTINPLVLSGGSTYVFSGVDRLSVNLIVSDTWLPNDVNITYQATSTANDYVIEKLIQANWTQLTVNANFSQTDIDQSAVRIRFTPQNNPNARSLNQTIMLRATNGRMSFLDVNLTLTRIYDTGNCPSNAECDGSPTFTCLAGYTPNLDGVGCIQCANNFFKSQKGNFACSPCPTSSSCDSMSFTCAQGTLYNSTSNQCVPCPVGFFLSSSNSNQCLKCPVNAICSSTSFSCNPGYLRVNNLACDVCPNDAECDGSETFSCKPGYLKIDGQCRKYLSKTTGIKETQVRTATTTAVKETQVRPANSGHGNWWMDNSTIGIALLFVLWTCLFIAAFIAGFLTERRKFGISTTETSNTARNYSAAIRSSTVSRRTVRPIRPVGTIRPVSIVRRYSKNR